MLPAEPHTPAQSATLPRFAPQGRLDRWDGLAFLLIALTIYAIRQAFQGPVYFVDGPMLVTVIRIKWFITQSPHYWLFAHLGGLFRDPAIGLAFWNKLFSSLGVACFYLLGRLLGSGRGLALLAALTYGTSYHIWFSGEIHSSYAAEILFPVLTLCCFLRLQERKTVLWAGLAALSAGLAIALRPPDGIFLFPLWLFLLWRERYGRSIVFTFSSVSVAAFLAWYVPTEAAVHRIGFNSTTSQLMICLHATSVFLVGVNQHSLANISRVYLPLLVAYWPVLPLLFHRRSTTANGVLILWWVPGLLFFTFGYMADPTYVVFLSGAFLLAALLQANKRAALACLAVCLLWNAGIFLMAHPAPGKSAIGLAWNFYVVKYCSYGLRHQWTATLGRATSAGSLL